VARITLFPARQRIGFVRRLVASVATYRVEGRDRTISHQLKRQRDYALRLGIEPEQVDEFVRELRLEIEARLPDGRRSAR